MAAGLPVGDHAELWVNGIAISYNLTDHALIGELDVAPPCLGGWTLASGGVPQPFSEATEAYDLVATASADFAG